MDDNQENHLSRAQKVSQFIEDHAADLALTPSVTGALKTKLDADIAKVLADDPKAVEDLTGYTDTKDSYRNALNNSCDLLSSGLASLADDTDDFVLLHMVDYAPTTIAAFRDSRVLDFAKYLLQKASVPAVAAALAAGHGVLGGDLTDADTNITNYEDWIAQPREKIGERSGWNLTLDRDFETLNTTVTKIRTKMQVYRIQNPDLYGIYQAIDGIDDTGSGSGEVFAENLTGGQSKRVAAITYNATTPLRLQSTGSTDVSYGFRLAGASVGSTITVTAGAIVNKVMSDLATNGDELWVKNLDGAIAGSYKATIG